MRPTCLNCARKHLAQADILMMEAAMGYPIHAWYAMGHMAEASDEIVADYPEMANEIREMRKLYEEAVNEAEDPTSPKQPRLPHVDIPALIAKISELARDVDVEKHELGPRMGMNPTEPDEEVKAPKQPAQMKPFPANEPPWA